MLELNGKKYEFDMSDADTYAAYMKSAEQVDAVMNKVLPEQHSAEEYIELTREKCKAVRAWLDAFLGDGIGKEVLPRDSGNKAVEVYDTVIGDVYDQIFVANELAKQREEKERERRGRVKKLKAMRQVYGKEVK